MTARATSLQSTSTGAPAWPGPVLSPAGVEALQAAPMAWALLAGGTLIFVGVMLLLWLAVSAPARPVRARRWLLGGGLALPLVVLGALALANLEQIRRLLAAPPAGAALIGVQGRMWWWQVRLPDAAGGATVEAANELVLPVGRPVRLALSSAGVIHSVWVPALAGKVDLVPGRIHHLVLHATQAGAWSGPCAEFCGSGHSWMWLNVRAVPEPDYVAWLENQRRPARMPAGALEQRGLRHFAEWRCTACHRVRGVSEAVLDGAGDDAGGPDLTHLASRRTLGAGILPNDAAHLRDWIRDPQRFKPGARMPAYPQLDEASLDALVAYLGSLH
jgi:cytochrome c oxidase subunit 2